MIWILLFQINNNNNNNNNKNLEQAFRLEQYKTKDVQYRQQVPEQSTWGHRPRTGRLHLHRRLNAFRRGRRCTAPVQGEPRSAKSLHPKEWDWLWLQCPRPGERRRSTEALQRRVLCATAGGERHSGRRCSWKGWPTQGWQNSWSVSNRNRIFPCLRKMSVWFYDWYKCYFAQFSSRKWYF